MNNADYRFQDSLLEIQDMKIPDNSIVVSYGMPTSFVALNQNPKVRYVYGTTDVNYEYEYSEKSRKMVRKLLEENKDKIYAIYSKWTPKNTIVKILDPGYKIDYDSCKSIYNTNSYILGLCKIESK